MLDTATSLKKDTRRKLLQSLSRLIDYPEADLQEEIARCIDAIPENLTEMKTAMEKFLKSVRETPIERMEEIYTGAFDVSPAWYPYAGYQIFGESFKRGEFLAALKGKYSEHGFKEPNELADHFSVILKFMSELDPDNILIKELAEDGLAPALDKMLHGFKKKEEQKSNPYLYILEAIFSLVEEIKGERL